MSHRYFVPPFEGQKVNITGDDARHLIKVLRIKVGDDITVCDGAGFDYRCVAERVSEAGVELDVLEKRTNSSEPGLRVTVFAGYPKGDKLDTIVQKCTELGCAAIIPFTSRYCVAQPKNGQAKLVRLRRIAAEAAKQCGRGLIPQVGDTVSYTDMLKLCTNYDKVFFCYEHGGTNFAALDLGGAKNIAVITGAEGGFSEQEALQAQEAGCTFLSLGRLILRCETAPEAALCLLFAKSGDM